VTNVAEFKDKLVFTYPNNNPLGLSGLMSDRTALDRHEAPGPGMPQVSSPIARQALARAPRTARRCRGRACDPAVELDHLGGTLEGLRTHDLGHEPPPHISLSPQVKRGRSEWVKSGLQRFFRVSSVSDGVVIRDGRDRSGG
jgi:hypothetical protein